MTTKMKKSIVISFLLSVCVGICLYFTYELSHYNRIVGLFAPINESPWEQMKLLFFPFLFFTIILYFSTKRNSKNIVFANSISIVIGMVLALILHYTILGAFGLKSLFINAGIYIICSAVIYILCYYFFKNNTFSINNTFGLLFFVFLILAFILLTFMPPRIPLFQDETTNSFGLIHEQAEH